MCELKDHLISGRCIAKYHISHYRAHIVCVFKSHLFQFHNKRCCCGICGVKIELGTLKVKTQKII